jgi:hypothetical protein
MLMLFSLLQNDSCSGLKHIPACTLGIGSVLTTSSSTLMAILPIGMFFATVSFNVLTVYGAEIADMWRVHNFLCKSVEWIEVPAPKGIVVGQWIEQD